MLVMAWETGSFAVFIADHEANVEGFKHVRMRGGATENDLPRSPKSGKLYSSKNRGPNLVVETVGLAATQSIALM
jgi:hypothetical protein